MVSAIVKPHRLDELMESVIGSGARGLTVTEVRGFGRQYGQLAGSQAAAFPAGEPQTALLPKIRLDLVVLDDGRRGGSHREIRQHQDNRRWEDLGDHSGQRAAGANRRA